ncbi:MAG: peptide chain release factor 3 [Oligoflexales bacterium]
MVTQHTAAIQKRRTFAIISHPDSGKTTMTEKLLLYGGAIQMAGSVKAKRSKKFATSDWMELEKQRGISVTSSVMHFPYQDHAMNLIDTPGHADFSEDTYRTLTAVDSALMLIDAAAGVESQTRKLFEVCALRKVPIMTFINKMDREGRDPFELMEEIEQVLGIATFPVTWPVGMGDRFRGVYHRLRQEFFLFDSKSDKSKKIGVSQHGLHDPALIEMIGEEQVAQLTEELELLDGAGDAFNRQAYLDGKLAPVFFGSALNSFGVESLLQCLIDIAPSPRPRPAVERVVEATESKFTAFIFKIQANMDPSHRDRVAFLRICSGRFERGMKAHHVREGRSMRLGRPTHFLAQDRSLVDEAYAGDIVGIHDPGLFRIGDSLSEGETITYTGIPVFAPEHFVRVELEDPLKSKQLHKALNQLSEEGAVQVFRPMHTNNQYLGVVGSLQIDIVQYRIQAEYGVKVRMTPLPYQAARWVQGSDEKILKDFERKNEQNICLDSHGNPTLLLDHEWRLRYYEERNPGISFSSTSLAVGPG